MEWKSDYSWTTKYLLGANKISEHSQTRSGRYDYRTAVTATTHPSVRPSVTSLQKRHMAGDGFAPTSLNILTIVGQQILLQFVALIFEHLAQVGGHFTCNCFDIRIQTTQIVGQANQLIQCANLLVENVFF